MHIAANDGLMDLMPPDENEEIKNGQWMGVTVRSQGIGGKVSMIQKRERERERKTEST